MADLTAFLNKHPPKLSKPPEDQLLEAILESGLEAPDSIQIDGKIHRFNSGKRDRSSWYVAFPGALPAGRFGDWRLGIDQLWRADIGRSLSVAEEMSLAKVNAEAQRLRQQLREKQHEAATESVREIWDRAAEATGHPYLERKRIGPHGARITTDGRLMIPLLDETGEIRSIQYISHSGEKLYHSGAPTRGTLYQIGENSEPGPIYIAEGFATAATIHETMNRPCIAAFSASALVIVTGIVRETYGKTQEIVIVADNDRSEVGLRYAEQASAKYGARVVMPPEVGQDANDYALAGGNLQDLLSPQTEDWLVLADAFAAQPAPTRWLVKHWVPEESLIMVHGPSGSGKTFLVLDWALRISSMVSTWQDLKVRGGNVVYLAGEGHNGLRSRIAAWKQEHRQNVLNCWLSRDGLDLNSPQGYQRVVESLRALPHPPCLIVVDTLHRFLAGDENSSQDAKTMLDACSGLMREFETSVLLVHHTGVNEESQHRARGSSAWRGALDIEISVIPAKSEEEPIQVIQRKNKDSEIASARAVELKKVSIEGWFDEDGDPVTSAVCIESEKKTKAPENQKILNAWKKFESAWWASGAQVFEDAPHLTEDGLVEYLKENFKAYRNEKSKILKTLLAEKWIDEVAQGYRVLHPDNCQGMLLSRRNHP
jgi:putative DNA primase/helicase